MNRESDRQQYRVASAVPGRVRLQIMRIYRAETLLHACDERIRNLESVSGTRVAADALSLIVAYDRRKLSLEEFVRQTEAILAEETARPRNQSTITRPIRNVTGASKTSHNGRRKAVELVSSTGRIVGGSLQAIARRVPGQTETLHAMNLVNDRPSGVKPVLFSLVAIGLALVEAVPMAIAAGALALAAIPVAQRAAKGVEKRQLTVDELDLVNIALVAFSGQILAAGFIALLVSLTEVLRGKAVGFSRQSIARLLPPGEQPISPEFKQAIERIYQADLSNSRFQDEAMRAGNTFTYPLFVLAILMTALTRDPRMIVGILKPRTDYTSGIRLGIPVPILNSLIASRQHGPLITSAAAVERLTLLDVVIVTEGVESSRAKALSGLEASLAERGIRLLPMQDTPLQEETSLLNRLQAEGFVVGVLGTTGELRESSGADLRIALDRQPDVESGDADVYLMESGLSGTVLALDIAWEAARICRLNTGLYGTAAITNLTTSLLQISPPPLSSLINAVTMAAAAGNSLRPLLHTRPRGDVRRLPEVVPIGNRKQ